MATTRELVGALINVNQELEYLEQKSELDMDAHKELEETRMEIHRQVSTKLENVDQFMVELDKRSYVVDAEIEHLKEEIDRLEEELDNIQQGIWRCNYRPTYGFR